MFAEAFMHPKISPAFYVRKFYPKLLLFLGGITIAFHKNFVENLLKWFEKDLSGTRIVITHHAPVMNPDTRYGDSKLTPAFNSLDMGKIIRQYQPRLWVYGHTHECDNQMVGKTQIISNQRGYPNRYGEVECKGFDEAGLMVEV